MHALTLDGNEQYTEVDAFRELWSCLARERRLERLLERLIFVEQPLTRTVALTDSTRNALLSWTERPPIIIDESDASLESLSRALVCGYVGTSHKNCKGVFKGILNRCSLAQRKVVDPAEPVILSGEDLSNVGPVALLQDLAVAASLGIGHLERNGHHYFRGLSMYDEALQHQVLTNHPDLYERHAAGFAALQIENGAVRIDSVVDARSARLLKWIPPYLRRCMPGDTNNLRTQENLSHDKQHTDTICHHRSEPRTYLFPNRNHASHRRGTGRRPCA